MAIVDRWPLVEARLHNGHLSPTAIFFFADSPYIHSCFNLSTMATFFCPQDDRCSIVSKLSANLPLNSANLILSHLNHEGLMFTRFVFEELKNSEIAQRTNDIPPALQH